MANTITILDGGMSRELIRLNAPFRQPEWSALALLETPHLVRQAHLEFALAGADIITTNSYALVPFHIGQQRFEERGAELAALAGRLAREAADEASSQQQQQQGGRKVRVAGSLPPIFGSYEPEKFDRERVHEFLAVLVDALSPYVDFWLGETLSLVAEAQAVRDAVQHTGKPLWISFCPDDSVSASLETPCLRSGQSVADTVQWAQKAEAEALLFNCCNPEYAIAAIKAAKEVLGTAEGPMLGVYANAFVPRANEYAANSNVSATDDSLDGRSYAAAAQTWVANGASIVGGCCGIGVAHIKCLADDLRS